MSDYRINVIGSLLRTRHLKGHTEKRVSGDLVIPAPSFDQR